jgi:3-oxoacyl-[acyl-carrier protein] reductase
MKLGGQRALVTGASRGIGRAIAIALAHAGASVSVNYRTQRAAAEETVAAIVASGGEAVAIAADVGDYAQAEALVEQTLRVLGGLDIVVNNAGVARDGLIFDLTPEDWKTVMHVNFGGVFNCTKAALGHLMSQGTGSIVNISSVMGERAWVGDANYGASKAAVNSFTRSSALELARFGIRVNAVLGGFVPTEMVAAVLAKDGGRGILRQIPMRAFASVEDIAAATVFLAGPDARYITGTLLEVDGGSHIGLGVGSPLK